MAVSQELDSYDSKLESKVKSNKKSEARDQLKLIKQFESLSDSFKK